MAAKSRGFSFPSASQCHVQKGSAEAILDTRCYLCGCVLVEQLLDSEISIGWISRFHHHEIHSSVVEQRYLQSDSRVFLRCTYVSIADYLR